MKRIFFIPIFLLAPIGLLAQSGINTNGSNSTSIPTAVPFLNISPDSRSGAMGDAGVALSPDVNANYWNPAKLAFVENNTDISASYIPWLPTLIQGASLSNLGIVHKLNDRDAFGVSVRYFNLGSVQLYDGAQNSEGVFRPNEYAVDGSFARKFGDSFSLGLSLRYIHSNLSNQAFADGSVLQDKAANAVAADVSFYYKNPIVEFGNDALFAFGVHVSNLGPKISYTTNGPTFFLPSNLKIGAANTWKPDDYNQFTITLDLNKLLVPTPPIRDSNGNIIAGQNDDVSVPAGVFGSFTDAPGGFKEELQEITYSPGIEYLYNNLFAVRAGYFYQDPNKGNLHYLTLGLGVKYKGYQFDFSYIAANQQSSPLANTLKFSVSAGFN